MKKFLCFIGLFLFTSLFNINIASTAPRKHIKKIIQLITNPKMTKGLIARYKENLCDGIPSCLGGAEFTIVFVYKDKLRYTFSFKQRVNGLTIWLRREGTQDSKNLNMMQDLGANGSVDVAMIGKDGSDACEKVYRCKKCLGGTLGLKYRHYWQKLYDKAIAAAIKHFKLNTKQAQKPYKVPIGYHYGSL